MNMNREITSPDTTPSASGTVSVVRPGLYVAVLASLEQQERINRWEAVLAAAETLTDAIGDGEVKP